MSQINGGRGFGASFANASSVPSGDLDATRLRARAQSQLQAEMGHTWNRLSFEEKFSFVQKRVKGTAK